VVWIVVLTLVTVGPGTVLVLVHLLLEATVKMQLSAAKFFDFEIKNTTLMTY